MTEHKPTPAEAYCEQFRQRARRCAFDAWKKWLMPPVGPGLLAHAIADAVLRLVEAEGVRGCHELAEADRENIKLREQLTQAHAAIDRVKRLCEKAKGAVSVDAVLAAIDGPVQPDEPESSQCRGFHWIGQPLTHCENCDRPAWEHDGWWKAAEELAHGYGRRLKNAEDAVARVRDVCDALEEQHGGAEEIRQVIGRIRDACDDIRVDDRRCVWCGSRERSDVGTEWVRQVDNLTEDDLAKLDEAFQAPMVTLVCPVCRQPMVVSADQVRDQKLPDRACAAKGAPDTTTEEES